MLAQKIDDKDFYSLQTAKPIKPYEFCFLAEDFFDKQKLITIEELKEKIEKNLSKWLIKLIHLFIATIIKRTHFKYWIFVDPYSDLSPCHQLSIILIVFFLHYP